MKQIRSMNVYRFYYNGSVIKGTVQEIAQKLNIDEKVVYRYVNYPTRKISGVLTGQLDPIYEMIDVPSGRVLYRGTLAKIANESGINISNVKSYMYNPTKKFEVIFTNKMKYREFREEPSHKPRKQEKTVLCKPGKPLNAELKVSGYWNDLFKACFKNWDKENVK